MARMGWQVDNSYVVLKAWEEIFCLVDGKFSKWLDTTDCLIEVDDCVGVSDMVSAFAELVVVGESESALVRA